MTEWPTTGAGEPGIPEEPEDAIVPTTIVHDVDDLRSVGPQAFYNFLIYSFERDGVAVQARAYLDAIDNATVLTMSPPANAVEAKLIEDVVAYLNRRYSSAILLHEMGDRG